MKPRRVIILHDAAALAGGATAVLAEIDALKEKDIDIILLTWNRSPKKFVEEAAAKGARVYIYPGDASAKLWRVTGLPLMEPYMAHKARQALAQILEKLSRLINDRTLVHVHQSMLETLLPAIRREQGGIWIKTIHSALYTCPLQATPGTWLGLGCKGYWIEGSYFKCLRDAARLGITHMLRVVRGVRRLEVLAATLKVLYEKIISPSKFLADMLRPVLGVEKIAVIRNPLPRDEWLYAAKMQRVEKKPYVLFIGRLAAEKGVMDLETVARLLSNEGARLIIAGEGPLSNIVKKLVSKNLAEYVGYVWAERKYKLLAHASVMVFPSHAAENMPMSVAEAFAFSTPVAAYDIGGQGELVRESGCGYLAHPFDAVELAARSVELVSEGRDVRERCKRWSFNVSPDRYADKILSLFQEEL